MHESERTDLEWQRLPEIRGKFLDYVEAPTDDNALRIINACRERLTLSAQPVATIVEMSDADIADLALKHGALPTGMTMTNSGSRLYSMAGADLIAFARAILAASRLDGANAGDREQVV